MTCLSRTSCVDAANCALPRFAARLVCVFGVLFSAFALAEWNRLGVVAAGLLVWVAVRRFGFSQKLEAAGFAVCRSERFAAMMLLVVAIVFRMVCYLAHEKYSIGIFQSADANQFWKWSQEMAAGSFPEAKSWTTVAAYALCIKLFGNALAPAYVLNFVLQVATAGTLLGFGCRMFGRKAGWLSAVVYLLSPTFVLMTFSTLSEHFFFLFVALSLLCAERWASVRGDRWLFGMAVCSWLSIWSRGEGLLVLGILGVCLMRKSNYCPPELIPYIQAETARRWKAMSLSTMIRFVVKKEHFDWAHAFAGSGRTPASGVSALLHETVPAIILLLSLFGFAWRLRHGEFPMAWMETVPILVIGGMCCVLALYESNIRYGTMLLVLLPFYAAWKGFGSIVARTGEGFMRRF